MTCEKGQVRNIATGECEEMVSLTPQTTTTTTTTSAEVEKDDFDKAIEELKAKITDDDEFYKEAKELFSVLCYAYNDEISTTKGGRRKSRKRRKKRGGLGGCKNEKTICETARTAYIALDKAKRDEKLNGLIEIFKKLTTFTGANEWKSYELTGLEEECGKQKTTKGGRRKSRKRKSRKTRRKRRKSRRKSRRRKRRTKRRR